MILVRKRLDIKASPEKVWAILGDLSRAPEYVPAVVQATVNGTQRWCRDASGNDIREDIVEYSVDARRYSFRHRLVPRDEEMAAQLTPMIGDAAAMTLDNVRKLAEAGT